jgi:hypothetical protein
LGVSKDPSFFFWALRFWVARVALRWITPGNGLDWPDGEDPKPNRLALLVKPGLAWARQARRQDYFLVPQKSSRYLKNPTNSDQ